LHQDLALVCILWGCSTYGWFIKGKESNRFAYILAELSLLALFATLRRHLMLTTNFWTYEYDVWASLAVSACLTGSKRFIDHGGDRIRWQLAANLIGLPVIGIVWTYVHNLGTDLALTVVGIHSLFFAFLGKDDRESPYNVIAIAGFVAFVLMVFWTKLDLRVLHAYVLPVGMGVLVLLQLFAHRIDSQTQKTVRFATLASMFGTTAYYAILDPHYPIAFHLTLLVLSLLLMGCGSFLRVKSYLLFGFVGILTGLASISFKVVVQMDTTLRMMSIGGFVLLLGVAVVAGSIYYKTHREELDQALEKYRAKLNNWA
jgi:hypothetical protein